MDGIGKWMVSESDWSLKVDGLIFGHESRPFQESGRYSNVDLMGT